MHHVVGEWIVTKGLTIAPKYLKITMEVESSLVELPDFKSGVTG